MNITSPSKQASDAFFLVGVAQLRVQVIARSNRKSGGGKSSCTIESSEDDGRKGLILHIGFDKGNSEGLTRRWLKHLWVDGIPQSQKS